jgi:hypothetical protein
VVWLMKTHKFLKKKVTEYKIMKYINCGQKTSFNPEFYYVCKANDKLMKVYEGFKVPDNKFDYSF